MKNNMSIPKCIDCKQQDAAETGYFYSHSFTIPFLKWSISFINLNRPIYEDVCIACAMDRQQQQQRAIYNQGRRDQGEYDMS